MSIKLLFNTTNALSFQDETSESWVNMFKKSILTINISELEVLLDDDMIINDQTKWEFLSEIRNFFNRVQLNGNTELTMTKEKCLKCFHGCPVHLFKGKANNEWISFYVKEENGVLVDITICNLPTGI